MDSSAEQETRLCGNCKHDIPVVNFTIHEIHCRRNIIICKLCKEPIPRSEMEDHHASEHALVTCKCNMTMEKCALEEHEKSSCPLRLVKCQFCELEVTFNTLENHEDYCGARTEQCKNCGSSVMIKDLTEHPAVCGKVKAQKKPARVHSWEDSRDYASVNRSALVNNLLSQVPSHVPKRFYRNSILTQLDDLNQYTRREQERDRTPQDLDIDSPLDFFDHLSEEKPKPFRNYDHSHLQRRQNKTRSSPESDDNLDFWRDYYCKDNKMKTNVEGRSNLNYFSTSESAHLNSPSTLTADAIQLPCEFCEELFPEHDLILHQSGCRPSVTSSVRRRSPSPPLDFIEHLRSSSPPAHSPQSVIIPCEFCGVLMEGDILFHHQDQCDMGPNSEKTSHFSAPSFADNVSPEVASEDEYRSYMVPTPSQTLSHRAASGSEATVSFRNQTRRNAGNATRAHGRIDNLYRPMNNTRQSSLEEMRKGNMEENARMARSQSEDFFGHTQGASSRNTSTRGKPKKKINSRSDEVDKEE
ncbi:TRAF-type zinc finger domain-containing protein 1 [Bufo bufo]|uniref:TRAF-type zinc finger domain-containing protein 1 n=1 Tax=Bufo bufo TaxID=8384 RepID=UPI001ABE4156|nr:TRAF-type zinc finger domain-containing protein 1 [Bufo bufo]